MKPRPETWQPIVLPDRNFLTHPLRWERAQPTELLKELEPEFKQVVRLVSEDGTVYSLDIFILADDEGKDVWVHASDMCRTEESWTELLRMCRG